MSDFQVFMICMAAVAIANTVLLIKMFGKRK